ncbi:MAG: hypothetical protein ACXVGF_04795 [Blastococcus sp.]
MAIDTYYALTIAQGIASGAPNGTGDPGAPTTAATGPASPWYDFGAISSDGLTENPSQSRQEFKRWGAISPFAAVITDQKHEFQVKFLENNANVLGLAYRTGSTPTPTGTSSNEVQTVTITGAPTGGTFVLDIGGQPTTDLAYNASTSVVQTALQALSTVGSGNVTVTGTPGSSYVLTFGGSLAAANVPQAVAVGNFTGGTSPSISVATTTGGTAGSLLTITDDTTGVRDIRAFCFDLIQGTNHLRFYVPQGEVTALGNITYKNDALIEYDVTITAYPNGSGVAVKRYMLLDAIRLGL